MIVVLCLYYNYIITRHSTHSLMMCLHSLSPCRPHIALLCSVMTWSSWSTSTNAGERNLYSPMIWWCNDDVMSLLIQVVSSWQGKSQWIWWVIWRTRVSQAAPGLGCIITGVGFIISNLYLALILYNNIYFWLSMIVPQYALHSHMWIKSWNNSLVIPGM